MSLAVIGSPPQLRASFDGQCDTGGKQNQRVNINTKKHTHTIQQEPPKLMLLNDFTSFSSSKGFAAAPFEAIKSNIK